MGVSGVQILKVQEISWTAEKIHFFTPPPPNWSWGGGSFMGQNWREGWKWGIDGNYEVGAYGMEWVHNREPEQSRVTS